jgi:hypothetical protein
VWDPLCWPRNTLYLQSWALTSPTYSQLLSDQEFYVLRNPKIHFHKSLTWITFCNKRFFLYSELLLPHTKLSKWRTAPYRLSTIIY